MKKTAFAFLAILLVMACHKNTANQQVVAKANQTMAEVIAIGRVEPLEKIGTIGCQMNGVVKRIYAQAGDTVKKGAVIIELIHDYEDALLQQANSKLTAQKAEINGAKAQLNSARLKTDNLRAKLERTRKIVAMGADTHQNLDDLQTEYDQGTADIERYTALLNSAEAKINEIITDAAVVEAQIDQKKIKAPVDGTILNMDITPGTAVTTGKSLFDFAPRSPLTVLCEVDELFADKIKVGQTAYIRNQGMDTKLAEGKIIFTGSYLKKKSLFSDDSGNMEDRRVREVRILISPAAKLLFNSRVEAVINIK